MGIQGLLPFLKKIHEPVNVSQFAGCTVAIDAYCWLHKGAFSCAEKLALGEKTDQYVYYCMKYINYLLSKNIKPIMVFDGCHLPSKKNVEQTRREKREMNRKKAAQFLREGRRAEARECLQRCIDISPEMALELMNVCRDKGVDCIVAPYEADAQLAYLNKCGIAQVVITEDSDLLLFGCERVIFKMDHVGNGILIEQKRLNEVMEIQSGHFTFDKFRYMCILSGCDYLASLPGIGLARANKVFKIARQGDVKQLLKKLPTYLKSNITVPQEYIDGFIAADNTFLYQLVFDPLKRKLVPLTHYPPDVNKSELSYAGQYMPQQKALDVALGNINIYTGEKFADFDPDTFKPKYGSKKKPDMLHMLSIWNKNYRVRPRGALHERQEPERPNLKGREVVVKAHVKKSPHKRVREEAEDCKDVMSNNELSSLYSDMSPVKKKARRDVDSDLQRFLFVEGQQGQGNQSEEEEEEDQPKPQSGPARSPRFFNSLSSAHPEVKVEATESADTEKENNVKSPRNKFACKSPAKKPRFSLNAVLPDVKSRFFAGSSKSESRTPSVVKNEPKSSTPDNSHRPQDDLSEFKPVHKNTLNLYIKSVVNEPEPEPGKESSTENLENADIVSEEKVKPFSFSKLERRESEKSSPSPTSAFSWSKFKFSRHSSSDQLPQLDGNKNVKSQYKKVVSESNLEKYLKKQTEVKKIRTKPKEMSYEEFLSKENQSENENDTDEGLVVSLELDAIAHDDSGVSPSTNDSDESYPCSIDSACISQGDLNMDSQKSSTSGTLDTQNSSNFSQVKSSCMTSSQNLKNDGSLVENTERSNSDYPEKNAIIDKSDNPPSTCEDNEHKLSDSTSKNVFKAGSIYFQSTINDKSKQNETDGFSLQEVVSLIDSDDDMETNNVNSGKATPKKVGSVPLTTSKSSVKSGCRVSGLRKGSKKQNKTAVHDAKQQNLKDMFLKFAHKTGDQPKLTHRNDKMKVLEDDEHTPESSKSVIGIKSGTQRRIL